MGGIMTDAGLTSLQSKRKKNKNGENRVKYWCIWNTSNVGQCKKSWWDIDAYIQVTKEAKLFCFFLYSSWKWILIIRFYLVYFFSPSLVINANLKPLVAKYIPTVSLVLACLRLLLIKEKDFFSEREFQWQAWTGDHLGKVAFGSRCTSLWIKHRK